MKNLDKYKGIFPAFYACYDDEGNISTERIEKLARHYAKVGVKGLYVGGSSGECIYQSVSERKQVLEAVINAVKDTDLTIIAHVAATSTKDSIELAKHAKEVNADALAALPPIYFAYPEYAIERYWKSIINATDLDFIIYNIPATTGYALSVSMLNKMLDCDQVIGVKNSSISVQDIYFFKHNAVKDCIVFNGPDEQFIAGRIMGADAGIGGTYGVMPELFLAANKAFDNSNIKLAQEIQYAINDIIFNSFTGKGNMYSIFKEILKLQGLNIGGTREPLEPVSIEDIDLIQKLYTKIEEYKEKYC